jgi:hypothetical protein
VAKKIVSKNIEKEKYKNYLKKAEDFYTSMQSAYKNKNWNSTGLEAVHCAISANDALLTFYSGKISTGPDHQDAVRLLEALIAFPETADYSKHLRRIIAMKNVVEYEARLFHEGEASEILLHTERFFNWVKAKLPG